jgi:hypothetical protein
MDRNAGYASEGAAIAQQYNPNHDRMQMPSDQCKGLGGAMLAGAIPKGQPEIVAQTSRLTRNTEVLGKALEELGQRLVGLLRPEGPQPAPGHTNAIGAGTSTAMGTRLAETNSVLEQLGQRLDSIIARLEV